MRASSQRNAPHRTAPQRNDPPKFTIAPRRRATPREFSRIPSSQLNAMDYLKMSWDELLATLNRDDESSDDFNDDRINTIMIVLRVIIGHLKELDDGARELFKEYPRHEPPSDAT